MRVLHIEAGRHLYGGAEQVLYLLRGLHQRGIDNLLACPPKAHIAQAARTHAQVHEIAMHGDLDIALATRIRRLAIKQQVDLVHVHSRRGADIWGGIGATLAGVPAVLSRRVDNPERPWLADIKYRRYKHLIAISEGIREVLLAQGLAAEKVSCVRSALDPSPYLRDYDKAALLASLQLPADSLLAGMAAQLIARKGHRYLLAALPKVLERHPRLQVLIFGRGPLREQLEQDIAAAGLSGQVRLMGFVDDLISKLGCLDLLVHPADREGLGIALLQASAAKVPIIASRAGGMPEAVRDGRNGILIEVGDVEALAEAMIRLLDSPELRQQMGEAGRQLILDEFSIDTMCEGNLAIYRKVLGS